MLLAFGISFAKAQGWIAGVGYPALFGLLFACGLGLPLPEDIPLVIAGALIAKGSMSWPIAAVCAWLGIIGGDICLYTIGKRLGPGVTKLPGIGKHVTEKRLERVHALYDQYGVGVIAVGRLFAGIRGAMVVCAGTIRYNFITFIIADGLAAVVSGGLWMFLGHWLGSRLTPEIIEHYKYRIIAGMIVIAVLFVSWILWKRRNPKKVLDSGVKAVKTVGDLQQKAVGMIKRKSPEEQTAIENDTPSPCTQGEGGGEGAFSSASRSSGKPSPHPSPLSTRERENAHAPPGDSSVDATPPDA